jgi:hypothetical protein
MKTADSCDVHIQLKSAEVPIGSEEVPTQNTRAIIAFSPAF